MIEIFFFLCGILTGVYNIIVLTNMKDKAEKRADKWEEKYSALMHAYKAIEVQNVFPEAQSPREQAAEIDDALEQAAQDVLR